MGKSICKSFFKYRIANKNIIVYNYFCSHKVIRVLPTSIEQLKSLRAIGRTNALLVDFWIEPRSINHPVVMRIAPDQYEQTIDYLKANQLSYEIQIDSLRS
jgi:hypothetical protein